MIEVNNLTKRYGNVTAIEDITFSVEKGEILGFLGPNGAGKTTTMRILTCFMPATSGNATVAGYDIFKESLEVRKRIGYLPENVPLYDEMKVKSYLKYVSKIKGIEKELIHKQIDEVLETCALSHMKNRIIGHLSKGYRQRVGLAQALIHNPEVLILDEPTSGLDPGQIIEIRNLIKQLGKERTVILSTHILPEASMTCERIIIIDQGRLTGEIALENDRVVSVNVTNGEKTKIGETKRLYVEFIAENGLKESIQKISELINVKMTKDKPEDNKYSLYIDYPSDSDFRSEIASTIVSSGGKLLEMRPMEMTLEEAFLELTGESGNNSYFLQNETELKEEEFVKEENDEVESQTEQKVV